jgi:cell volume regulation protein A
MSDGELILVAAALLAAGIAASLVASRVRLPGLLLFLGLGMVIGTDGLGWIDFNDYELARTIGVVALALILFEGGLTAGFEEIRPVLRGALSLAIFGTLGTCIICGLAASALLDLTTVEGLELGAILSATDGAAIFALLRASTLRRPVARTLEGESGFNDPVAVLLVVGFIEWIETPGYGVLDMVLLFVREMGIGAVVGLAVGTLSVQALRRTKLASSGLYPVATLSTAGLAFGGAATLHGSGFLAAYLAGLVLGSGRIPAKQTVTVFHEGLAWVAQIAMFLALGLLVFPSDLPDVWVEGTVITLILVFVARPVSAALATAFEDFNARERLVIGWAGLRGAVPVVLATFAVIDQVPRGHAHEFFNIVFFAVVISTLLQGSTVQWLAQKLGVTTSEPALPRPLVETGTVRRLGAEIVEYPVGPDDAIVGQLVRELGLPRDALLSVIVRGDEALLPRGSTRIEAADRLHVMVREEVAEEMEDLLERWRVGPVGLPPRRQTILRSGSAVFSTRPWAEDDGDAGFPREVSGVPVAEQIRTRRDQRGALVQLVDGRFACTGPQLALGGPLQLQRYARRRLGAEEDAAARAWWQEVIGALAR